MPDWVKFVCEHLSLRDCPGDCQAQIVEEIAEQLEDAYQEALRPGVSEEEAFEAACRHVPDWRALAQDLQRAGLRRARLRPSRVVDNADKSTAGRQSLKPSLSHSQPEKITPLARAGMILSNARQDLKYAMRLLARNYALVTSIPWHFAPPAKSPRKQYAKKLIKSAVKWLVSLLPRSAKKRLKRLAQFVVQNS